MERIAWWAGVVGISLMVLIAAFMTYPLLQSPVDAAEVLRDHFPGNYGVA